MASPIGRRPCYAPPTCHRPTACTRANRMPRASARAAERVVAATCARHVHVHGTAGCSVVAYTPPREREEARALHGVVLGVRHGFRAGLAAVDPGTRFAGLSLLLRSVLTLQRHGVAGVVLVVEARDAELARHVAADARVRVEVTLAILEDGEALL